jgi:DNA polymerase-3 subunit gamma/tau
VVGLAETLTTLDPAGVMRAAHALEQWAPDHAQLLDELAGLLMRVATRQVLTDFEDELYAPEVLERLAKAIAPEDVQLFYQTAITGRRDLVLAPDPRTGFEMTLLRMIAFRPGVERPQAAGAPPPARAPQGPPPQAAPAHGAPAAAAPAAVVAPAADGSWASILAALEIQGAARMLASNCVLLGRDGPVVRLGLDPKNKTFRNAASEDRLAQALTKYYGQPVKLQFESAVAGQETPAQQAAAASQQELESARRAFTADPGVQNLRERFNATVLPDTVRPVK